MEALQPKRPTIANWFSSLRRQPKNKKKSTPYNGLSDDKHLQRSCFDLSANSTFYVSPLESTSPDFYNDKQKSSNTGFPVATSAQNSFKRSSSENCTQNNEQEPSPSNSVAQICSRCGANSEQSATFIHASATPTKTTQRITHTISTRTRVSPQQSITTNRQTKFAQDYCRSESHTPKPNSPTTLVYSKSSELKRISKTTTTNTLIISRPVQLVLNEKGEIVEKQPYLLETKPRSNSLDCVLNEPNSEEEDQVRSGVLVDTQTVRSNGFNFNPDRNSAKRYNDNSSNTNAQTLFETCNDNTLCKDCRKVAELNLSNAINHGPPESPVIMRNHHQQIKDELVEVVSEMEALDVPEDSKHSNKDKQMSIGRKKFNMDPKKGIEYLVEHSLLRHDPQDVAHFLYKGEGLNKTAIGDFLGEKNDFNEDVLRAFVELHDFTNLILVQALRQFLWSFRLPGEAQKIDRMMECFAQRYCQLNPDIFTNTDTCYVLSFAIIMLNTSLHNPSVKDKPTVEQFISMNRGINNGGDLPRGLLESLYESIRTEPFKIPQDDGNDLMHTFFNPDKEGWLWKQGGRYKSWKRRWFILNDNCLYYFEYTTDKEPRGIIPLENISVREIHDRSKPFCFELFATGGADIIKACKTDSEGKVVEGKHTVYRMSAATAEEQQDWIKRLTQSISHNPFYDILVQRKKKALSKS